MHIDWVTVAAQVLNFLILVWLLKRFLYRPITAAMERREAGIKSRLDEAAGMRAEADGRARDLAQARQELEDGRQAALAETRSKAEALRRRLTAEVHAEVEERRKAWHAELDEDQAEFVATLSREATAGFRQLAEDALTQLADESLGDRFAAVLARRLGDLDKVDVARLHAALAENSRHVSVETSAALSPQSRRSLSAAIRKVLGTGVRIAWAEPDPDLTGIRLRVHGETVDWTLAGHVDAYCKRLAAAFPEGAGAGLG